ncbi:MAG: hypothetical protein E7256_15260 [Lachnospiraceae bacterium]|nr:hypothetical protein [Lachnospiraceae bacterium]
MKELEFKLSKQEYSVCILYGIGICAACGYLFYRNLAAVLCLMPLSLYFIKKRKEEQIRKKRMEFSVQFKDAIHCIAASLEAGYAIENCIPYAIGDLKLMYDEEAIIIGELKRIIIQLKDHMTMEDAFMQMAARTKDEEVSGFAEVFVTAKRTGGDIIKIIRATSNTIMDKVEMKREIETMITEKQLEAGIMKLVPLGIILYMNITSSTMMSVLYEGGFGRVFMTVILIFYFIFTKWMEHITAIAV